MRMKQRRHHTHVPIHVHHIHPPSHPMRRQRKWQQWQQQLHLQLPIAATTHTMATTAAAASNEQHDEEVSTSSSCCSAFFDAMRGFSSPLCRSVIFRCNEEVSPPRCVILSFSNATRC